MKFWDAELERNSKLKGVVPVLNIRFDDKVRFGNSCVEFTDFCNFVETECGWLPSWSTGGSEKTVNFAPLLCVGAAEVLHYYTSCDSLVMMHLLALISESNPFPRIEQCKEHFSYIMSDRNREPTDGILGLFSLKFKIFDAFTSMTQRVVCLLFDLYKLNPKMFCEVLVDIFKLCYALCPPFIGTYEKRQEFMFLFNISAQTSSALYDMGEVLSFDSPEGYFFDFGAVKYTYPVSGVEHSITDGCGLGVYAFFIMMRVLFRQYGSPQRSFLEWSKKYFEDFKTGDFGNVYDMWQETDIFMPVFQEKFRSCIGDDFAGKFFTGKPYRYKSFSEIGVSSDFRSMIQNFGLMPMNVKKLVSLRDDDKDIDKVVKDYLENQILFKKAFGVEYIDVEFTSDIRSIPMSYASMYRLIESMMFCYVMHTKCIGTEKPVEAKITVTNSDEVVKLNDTVSSLQRQLSELTLKYDNLKELLSKEHSNYEHQLGSRTTTIQALREENEKLKDKLSRVFSFDDSNDSVEDTPDVVNVEGLISELNEWNFCIAGGRYSLEHSLHELGWNSAHQIVSVSELHAIPKIDIVCIQSKFVSHALVLGVEKYFKDALVMYYNGTNVKGLIRSCYKFVSEYISS